MSVSADTISQFGLFIFGVSAILLIAKHNKWGFVAGLAAQPFYYYTSFIHKQWGIFFATAGYTVTWLIGIYEWFFKKQDPIAAEEVVNE